jgi:hypothetical protein
LESEQVDPRDEEIFRLQQLLFAAEERIHELEQLMIERIPHLDGKPGIPCGAGHRAPVLAEEEKPYRRGYSQGFSLCRQYVEIASKNGVDIQRIAKELSRCESEIFKWRGKAANWTRGKIVKAEWPPDPTRPRPKWS